MELFFIGLIFGLYILYIKNVEYKKLNAKVQQKQAASLKVFAGITTKEELEKEMLKKQEQNQK